MTCPSCQADVMDVDIKCGQCGALLASTGAHRMIGQIVLGTYEIVDVLGQGGMSVVFKARHTLTNQEVALKILPPELAAHAQVKSRFVEEAKALAALDHPNIVHLYNFGQDDGSFVLAMQYVQGQTWERLIMTNARLDWRASVRIAIDVLSALEYAHSRGVVHRDMKPSNVLIRAHDHIATVMDFGIAKMTTSTRLTATGQTMGTVRYMSPEQVRGQDVDFRTDIYSLGATLYESLVGDSPFLGDTQFEIMTKHLSEPAVPPSAKGIAVPAPVEAALMRSLAKRAGDRFDSARDMRDALEVVLKDGTGNGDLHALGRDAIAHLPTRPPRSAGIGRSASSVATTTHEPRASTTWIVPLAAAAVILGGGATAATLWLRSTPARYASVAKIDGVSLRAGKQFGRLLIETDGTLTPDEVYTSYSAALKSMRGFEPNAGATFDVIDHVVVLPQPMLCKSALFPGDLPKDCATSRSAPTFGKANNAHMLLVANERAKLADAMRTGVAAAVCVFQPADLAPDRVDAICAMTKRFATREQARAD